MGYQPDPIFLQRCPAEVKALLSGENLYMAKVRSVCNSPCHCETGASGLQFCRAVRQPSTRHHPLHRKLRGWRGAFPSRPQIRSRRLGEAVGEQSDRLRKEAEAKAKADAEASKSKSS